MSDQQPRHPTALISWSHVDPASSTAEITGRQTAVLALSSTLRRNGIDADVDLYHLGESVDWTRWGPRRIAECDYVLVMVSQGWRLAWEGSGDPTKGAGAAAEADVLSSLYQLSRQSFLDKVRLVLLPGVPSAFIPDGLHGVLRYSIEVINDTGVIGLVRSLTKQPEFVKDQLRSLPSLPPTSPAPVPADLAPSRSTASQLRPSSPVSNGHKLSPGQRNALAKAQSYLRHTAFL